MKKCHLLWKLWQFSSREKNIKLFFSFSALQPFFIFFFHTPPYHHRQNYAFWGGWTFIHRLIDPGVSHKNSKTYKTILSPFSTSKYSNRQKAHNNKSGPLLCSSCESMQLKKMGKPSFKSRLLRYRSLGLKKTLPRCEHYTFQLDTHGK